MRTNFQRLTLIALALLCTLPLVAQSDRVAEREAKRRATETFLDRRQSDAARLEAAQRLGYPEDETMPALLDVGLDRKESDAIRLEALRRFRFGESWIDAVLRILADPNDGGEELDATLILELNKRVTFKPPVEIRMRLTTVLRQLLNDKRDKVRLQAFRAAVSNHDTVAVNVLADSLRRGTGFPIPVAEAIDLLDNDGATNHISALRPYVDHDDPAVQAKAVRALGIDPESRPRIVELATGVDTAKEVRVNALRALAREDERFPAYALPIVENGGEDGDVRFAAMHSFAGRMNYANLDPATQVRFAVAVERIAGDAGLRSRDAARIRAEARELLEYLKIAFPEVRKHYASR